MIKGRTKRATLDIQIGKTILDHAMLHNIDFDFSCKRGTCARCRCFVQEGIDLLSKPTDLELDCLDEEEIQTGYRLGCQAKVMNVGNINAINKTYF
jgi:2Fe-2S ferredoxin